MKAKAVLSVTGRISNKMPVLLSRLRTILPYQQPTSESPPHHRRKPLGEAMPVLLAKTTEEDQTA
jgi:hypothetical protein